jgi:trans-aconitate 2-methyltransferase
MDNNIIIDYYDNYIARQLKSGINDRIYNLYKRLIKAGLTKNSSVLEMGCGIGAMSYLLARKVKNGKIESIDFSPESIKIAQNRILQKNVRFFIADAVEYLPQNKIFDFITLFDLIEHIPVERHCALFKNLSNIATENTSILINIPNPASLTFDNLNNPEQLQIVDQPVPLNLLVNNLLANNLELTFFESHSIWAKDDYHYFIIRKIKDYKEIKLSDYRNILQKVLKKLSQTWIKLKYNYK